MGMSPHWDYPYPLHVDEWFGLGYGQEVIASGQLTFESPYERRVISYHPEMGFHMIWAFLGIITDVQLIDLFRLAPGILLVLLSFFTYIFGRKRGFGLEAALFIPLIPTSLWTLGPAFVVPVSVATLSIPLIVLPTGERLSRGSGPWLWTMLFLISGTLFVHPTTESLLTLIATLYIGSFLIEMVTRRRYHEALKLLGALGIRVLLPAIVLAIWMPSLTRSVLYYSTSRIQLPNTPDGLFYHFLNAFGWEAAFVGVLGMGFFIYRSDFLLRGLVLPFVAVVLALFVEFYPKYFIGPPPLYNRSWIMLGLLLAIFLGCAVSSYFKISKELAHNIGPRFHKQFPQGLLALSRIIGVLLIGVLLYTGLFGNYERDIFANYYHIIDSPVDSHYQWIGEHVDETERVASGEAVMGWTYPLFAGVGTKSIGADALPFSDPKANALRLMMAEAELDVPWLKSNGISVLYSCDHIGRCREMSNSGVHKVKEGVYVIPDK